jgi:acetyl esterase/lipase
VKIQRRLLYGKHKDETFDIVRPHVISSATPVVYVHGGAFVAVNSELLLHSVTPIARAGHTVYSLNYPLAPEVRYPEAVIAIIRCLAHLRSAYGVQSLALFGDSAGGNLVTVVAAILSNRELLSELQSCTEYQIKDLPMPIISSVVSAYGILDRHTFMHEWSSAMVVGCILRCYESKTNPPAFGNRLSLCDLASYDLRHFPRTLIIAASLDPLLQSSEVAAAMLHNKHDVDVSLVVYQAPHGFIGFPLGWTWGQVQASAVDATVRIVGFLQPGASLQWADKTRPGFVCPRGTLFQIVMGFLETNVWTGLTLSLLTLVSCAACCCGGYTVHFLLASTLGDGAAPTATAAALQLANWCRDALLSRPYTVVTIATTSVFHLLLLGSRREVPPAVGICVQ